MEWDSDTRRREMIISVTWYLKNDIPRQSSSIDVLASAIPAACSPSLYFGSTGKATSFASSRNNQLQPLNCYSWPLFEIIPWSAKVLFGNFTLDGVDGCKNNTKASNSWDKGWQSLYHFHRITNKNILTRPWKMGIQATTSYNMAL